MKILIISFQNRLDEVLSVLNKERVEISALITVKSNVVHEILLKHKVACQIYPYDYLSESINNFFFDYIVVCGFEELVIKDLKAIGIPKTKIIDLRMLYLPDRIMMQKTIRHYITTDVPYEMFITGLSYAYFGTNLKSYKKMTMNFSGISQDLYYDYKLMKHIFERKRGSFKYGIIGICPYSFHYDLSLSAESFRTLIYYSILKDGHNFHLNNDEFRELFSSSFLEMYDAIYPPIEVNLDDRIEAKSANNHPITLLGYLHARKRAEEWNLKGFPISVEENKDILEKYIRLCYDNNVKPVLVIFPVTDIYRRWFSRRKLDEFYYIINQLKSKTDFAFLDYFHSKNFSNEDFHDIDHLNINGSVKISELINSEILRMEKTSNL